MQSQNDSPSSAAEGHDVALMAGKAESSLERVLAIARRQQKYIWSSIAVFFVLGVLFTMQSVSRYTATTSIMIDSKQVGMSATTPLEGSLAFETGAVDSQVLLLMSDRIASNVIDHLDLAHNPAFFDPPQSGIAAVVGAVKRGIVATINVFGANIKPSRFEDQPVDIQRNLLVAQLENNLKVTRNARTYVLTIEYTDADPALARVIASTYASAYLQDQLESRFEISRRASTWLEERIREVKEKAVAAVQAADAFRAKNKLTESSGRLINEQSLGDVTAQLSMARNDLNSAQAKYDRLKQIVDHKDYAASNLDALANPLIASLRGKYLDAYKLNADISSRLGPDHASAVRARKEMDDYSHVIFQELTRMLESYQSEVQVVKGRIDTLQRSLEEIRKASDVDATALSKLKSLEQESTTYNNLYALYLQKAQDLVQQQSIPISDARIISDAELPLKPSYPKTLLIWIASLVLGAITGAAIAAVREYRDRGFRTGSQVRSELGLDFVAYLPRLADADFATRNIARSDKGQAPTHPRLFRSASKAMDMVLVDPLCHFAEALRSIKVSVDYHLGLQRPVVIGFISAFPNEGKSTTAKNFATLVARQGEKVVLLDCDLRNPQLTRSLTPAARHGLLDVLSGVAPSYRDLIYYEEHSGLAFLPASARGRVPATGDLLASPAMQQLISKLRSDFSFIIVDLAPLGVVMDARAAGSFVDGYHMVVEWGLTARGAVADIIASEPIIASRTTGVSLSKVEIEKLQYFDHHTIYGQDDEYLERYYHRPKTAGGKKAPIWSPAPFARELARRLFVLIGSLRTPS
jgi:polysaccharide biosynthesis transport protein